MFILRSNIRAVILILLPLFHSNIGFTTGQLVATLPAYCYDTHEQIERAEAIFSRICEGIKAYNSTDYKTALFHLEAANRMDIFEAPNYEALPFLALAYFQSGNIKKADNALRMHWLALQIDIGIIKCNQNEDFTILPSPQLSHISNLIIFKVAQKMCSPLYMGYYGDNKNQDYQRLLRKITIYNNVSNNLRNHLGSAHKSISVPQYQ